MSNEKYRPSERVLDEIMEKSIKFLRGVGTRAPILATLRSKGFSAADQAEGWELLQKASGFVKPKPETPKESSEMEATSRAIAELDNWDEPNFALLQAALGRRFPSIRDYLFRGDLAPAQGVEAVLRVKTLLDRIATLQQGADATRNAVEDQAALALLAQRGYTAEELQRVRDLVTIATQAAEPVIETENTVSAKEREQALLDLYDWHFEWSTVAHAVIKRRDYLIALGLAKRKKSDKATAENTK